MISSSVSKRGFTLIELLVVISIIALLSAIILASLSAARGKAQDAAKQELVKSFITALEEYALSNNGSYPVPLVRSTPYAEYINGQSSWGGAVCLETNQNGECSAANGWFGDSTLPLLDTALAPYIQIPVQDDNVSGTISSNEGFSNNVGGIDYTCVDATGSSASSYSCSGYVISWFYNGINSSCDGGADETSLLSKDTTNTYCAYASDPNTLATWLSSWGQIPL